MTNTWNPNKMTDFMYEKAVESLKEFGFIAPVIVRLFSDNGSNKIYQIIDGEHRWRAALSIGMKEIPVIIVDELTEDQAKKLTVVLNELKGQFDPGKLSDLLGELASSSSVEDLLNSMPFTSDMLKGFVGLDNIPLPKQVKAERGKRDERWVERTFRMPAAADEVLRDAINSAKRVAGDPDMEDWRAIELVAAEYLAGNG